MRKTVAIIQPHYLPWLGYFDMIDQVDTFVFLDTVQRVRHSWHHRNRIRTDQGWCWLTLPLTRKDPLGQSLREARIVQGKWIRRHARSIEVAYRRAESWRDHGDALLSTLLARSEEDRLVEVTIPLVEALAARLGIRTPFIRASELDVEQVDRVDYLVSICESLGADEYLSPLGARAYLQHSEIFSDSGVRLRFHHYDHPVYPQRFEGFVSHLSAVDLLLNCGPASLEILRSGRRPAFRASEARRAPTQSAWEAAGHAG
ncbi:MAG: WbqC family protein [Nitrospirae bacterium]|nr:WbqC family protein [Nitrospirota bacterium]